MICKEYAHCTWTHYRTQMPREEKMFWSYYLDAEYRRGELRKTETYRVHRAMLDATSGRPGSAVDAPLVGDEEL